MSTRLQVGDPIDFYFSDCCLSIEGSGKVEAIDDESITVRGIRIEADHLEDCCTKFDGAMRAAGLCGAIRDQDGRYDPEGERCTLLPHHQRPDANGRASQLDHQSGGSAWR